MVEQRVGILEHRVEEVEQSLQSEVQRAVAVDSELKELLIELKNKNPITEFVKENWKVLALWIAITSGGDVGQLMRIFGMSVGAGG